MSSKMVDNRLAFLLAKRNTILRYATIGRFQVGGGDIYQHKLYFNPTHPSRRQILCTPSPRATLRHQSLPTKSHIIKQISRF